MELTTEDGTVVSKPSTQQLQAALAKLGLPGNGFAILATASQHYLQVAGSRADGYVAEYRDGSERSHHSSKETNLSHQQMVDLMSAYLNGGPWKALTGWQHGFAKEGPTGRPSKGHRAIVMLFFAIGGISLGASAYFAYTTHRFLQRAVEVPGKVTKMVRRGDQTYAPIVEYVDLTGQRRVLHSSFSSNPPSFYEGESVKVVYDPADSNFPLGARIRSFGQLWGATLFTLVFGAVFGGIAGAHWLVVFRRKSVGDG